MRRTEARPPEAAAKTRRARGGDCPSTRGEAAVGPRTRRGGTWPKGLGKGRPAYPGASTPGGLGTASGAGATPAPTTGRGIPRGRWSTRGDVDDHDHRRLPPPGEASGRRWILATGRSVAATGLTVAATARRRPKTPGGDRAEKGLTGRSAWPRRSPREGAAGVAVVPRPHRGGRELPECRLAAGLNAVVATGLTVAAKAGQTGQPRRPPAVQEGAFPGPETGRWEARSSPRGVPGGGRKGLRARKDTNLRARSPPLQGDTLIPHPRLTFSRGFLFGPPAA